MGREIRYSVKPRSDPGPANVRSVVGAAALEHTFLRVLRFYPNGNIPLILIAIIILTKRASWRSVEPSNPPMPPPPPNIQNWTRASTFSLQSDRFELERVQTFGSQPL
jgi:hypothetical protein